jgi:hypothetical protein
VSVFLCFVSLFRCFVVNIIRWTWVNQWTVDKSAAFGPHDADGWYYGASFDRLTEQINKRIGGDVATKTSLVRRRRLMRTMRCTAPAVLAKVNERVQLIAMNRKQIEHTIREKEESLRTMGFYEENRAFVFEQSLGLATQGTVNTLKQLKDLFFKIKRLHQVLLFYMLQSRLTFVFFHLVHFFFFFFFFFFEGCASFVFFGQVLSCRLKTSVILS